MKSYLFTGSLFLITDEKSSRTSDRLVPPFSFTIETEIDTLCSNERDKIDTRDETTFLDLNKLCEIVKTKVTFFFFFLNTEVLRAGLLKIDDCLSRRRSFDRKENVIIRRPSERHSPQVNSSR